MAIERKAAVRVAYQLLIYPCLFAHPPPPPLNLLTDTVSQSLQVLSGAVPQGHGT